MDGHGEDLRRRLREARVLLVFTPRLCGERDPLEVLEAVLPWIDLVQVRPKAAERDLDPLRPAPRPAVTSAREAVDWTARVLDLVAPRGADAPPVLVNDRVDAARALLERGCGGVHLGQEDSPPELARELLGPDALIGLSTHGAAQVVVAERQPVDYLGFGPIRATATKGYERGLSCEAAWVASASTPRPVFAIGGIDATNVAELARVGRVAVGSAILSAPDPTAAARELRELLLEPDD